ncbi:MAG: ABC transporter permease, partial [Roseibacillus sp.]|nr:ABC transporter permease [Roseibacillus sp.]
MNTYAANGKETPYSMVASVRPEAAPFLPETFAGEDIVINDWLAEDLEVEVGEEISLAFFRLVRGNQLEEATAGFRVHGIVAREGLAADQLWMPDFPGVAEAEDAQDWAPGLPLDLGRIRQKDEDYWDEHRGTPKAFISEERGRELFGNRWGEFTSLRVPTREAPGTGLEKELLPLLKPGMAGLLLRNLGEEAQAAAQSPVDIAGLFLSMSIFLIVASVALTAMLFRFNIEQRNRESGLLAALGVSAGRILRWRLMEGLIIVTVSGIIGLFIAIAYSIGILRFLETIWSEDSAAAFFVVHLNPVSMITGLLIFIALSMGVIWFTVRKQARKSATLRLEAGVEEVRRGTVRVRLLLTCGLLCVLLGFGCIAARGTMGPQAAFFLSGTFFLIAGLLNYRAWLGWNGARRRRALSPRVLATLNSGRRPTRSLVVVGTLACGVFLVIAVTAFRKHGGEEWAEKSSGAGGFAFWIETTSPVNRAADAKKDPDYFELGDQRDLLGEIRPFRMGVGDDASCFNLNTAARPRLLATDAGALAQRGSFTLKAVAEGRDIEKGWEILREPTEPRVLRAFVDQ